MIISRTPVRISFFGGGTDFKDYYNRCGGAVLGTTINKYTYVSLNRLSDFFEYKIRVGYSKSELVNQVSEIIHPSVRECLKYKKAKGNLDIHIFADLPARTGLGSSSSFTVGFLHTLHALEKEPVTKNKLATEAHYVEQEMIKENVGCQDQIHAAYGGLNIIEFDSLGFKVRPVDITSEKKAILEKSMMVFYTGLTRMSSEVQKELVDKHKKNSNDDYLEKMKAMVYEAQDIISASPAEAFLKKFGNLLHEAWGCKKNLSSKVTNSFIDESYVKAMEAGAYGGKICGAGGGGFLVLFAPENRHDAIKKSIGLSQVNCLFENQGSTIIYSEN